MPEPKPEVASVSVLLQTLGVDVVEPTRVASLWVKEEPRKPTFVEVYGGGALNEAANRSRRDIGVKGVGAFDLRTAKPDGTPWDFNKRSNRALAREYFAMEKPTWVIGSPPPHVRCSQRGIVSTMRVWTLAKSPRG